jgi:uncharacterized integral membrane protein
MAPRPVTKLSGRREQMKLAGAVLLGGLAVLFAALNVDDVDVNWVFGTWQTPLIVVICVSFLLGAGVGVLGARRRARNHPPRGR